MLRENKLTLGQSIRMAGCSKTCAVYVHPHPVGVIGTLSVCAGVLRASEAAALLLRDWSGVPVPCVVFVNVAGIQLGTGTAVDRAASVEVAGIRVRW